MQSDNKKTLRQRFNDWAEENVPVLISIIVIAVGAVLAVVYNLNSVLNWADIIGTVSGLISSFVAIFTWYSIKRIRNSIKPVSPGRFQTKDMAILCISCIAPEPDGKSKEAARYIYQQERKEYDDCFSQDILDDGNNLGLYPAPQFTDDTGGPNNQYKAQYITEFNIDGKVVTFGRGRFINITVDGLVPKEHAQEYVSYVGMCLQRTIYNIKKSGIKKLKVFFNVPDIISGLIGYMSRNNIAVEFYHNFDGEYVSAGDMRLSWMQKRKVDSQRSDRSKAESDRDASK